MKFPQLSTELKGILWFLFLGVLLGYYLNDYAWRFQEAFGFPIVGLAILAIFLLTIWLALDLAGIT